MKDILPAFTFSFLMAQLFPGTVTVLFATSAYLVLTSGTEVGANASLLSFYRSVGDLWFGSTRNVTVFLFLSAATGMFLHGLDWMILGWETQGKNSKGELDENQFVSIRNFEFHSQPLWQQLLLTPPYMIAEIVDLCTTPALKWITIDENVSETDPKALPVFTWLQDFYLYFAQFYIHMSYALLTGLMCTAVILCSIGASSSRVIFICSIYGLTSLFFLMGRTQLATLFKNEKALKDATSKAGGPTEVIVRLPPDT